MSGGAFDYKEGSLLELKRFIQKELKSKETCEWLKEEYDMEVITQFGYILEQTMSLLDVAYIYLRRIDYFLSGDDNFKTMTSWLAAELEELMKNGG